MKKCAKCKDESSRTYSTYFEGGVGYEFCETCTDILETFPVPTNIMHVFLIPDDRMSQVNRNIFEARRRRIKGQSVWKGKM